jgi:hypothetical protein
MEKITGICSTHPEPDIWFTEIPNGRPGANVKRKVVQDINEAISLCNQCPSKDVCLEDGMTDNNIAFGIWGGVLAGERVHARFPDGFNRDWTIREGLGSDMAKAVTFLNRVTPWMKEYS